MRITNALALIVLLSACEKKDEAAAPVAAAAPEAAAPAAAPAQAAPAGEAAKANLQAKAELKALGNSGVGGTVVFTQTAEGGVAVTGTMHGLSAGEHGFHVHEVGNCDSPDGKSAGAHFNPAGAPHGDVAAEASHEGDLGNVVADASGNATINVTKKAATLAAGANSLVGKAVIVHKKQDDLKSQPAGDAGDRIACGVITAG